ncbi:ubiquinone/menaquinone biosynthesis C-methylase UbiE [Thermomonospora umbrina]|uniref:Ubiquinone/menaquinone biosynthesis C-methylase UbiE n=1 Tax=Thermomonospora umbrina TaxID=111806 RepID=A0A3D9SIH2_9ACTN|nr:ubiquinone/menaquinone biosynthesis C-methylase UbiE [Thermomonospora umbrina]
MGRLGVRERIEGLLASPPVVVDDSAGYLDLLGPADEPKPTVAQRFMQSSLLPQVYERLWRPIAFDLAKGWPLGPDTAEENALARRWLGLGRPDEPRKPDSVVLDVACGPGNVTRALAEGVGPGGLVVGLDASATMLAQAVGDPDAAAPIGYVRGNAVGLPFQDGVFDAVCCFGGLYLFDDPWAALDGMTRVLRPGGRLAILTSRRPGLPLADTAGAVAGRLTGIRLFGDREIVHALEERGFRHVKRRRMPLMQFAAGVLDR